MIAIELLAKTGEAAKSGPIGLAVILILCIVCYFLFKSMSKHLRIVREQFPKDSAPQSPAKPELNSDAADQPADDTPADS